MVCGCPAGPQRVRVDGVDVGHCSAMHAAGRWRTGQQAIVCDGRGSSRQREPGGVVFWCGGESGERSQRGVDGVEQLDASRGWTWCGGCERARDCSADWLRCERVGIGLGAARAGVTRGRRQPERGCDRGQAGGEYEPGFLVCAFDGQRGGCVESGGVGLIQRDSLWGRSGAERVEPEGTDDGFKV